VRVKSLKLLRGKVWHRRDKPAHNEFTYRVFYASYELNEPQIVKPALFSFNRFNVMSVRETDHGTRNGSSLLTWATDTFTSAGVGVPDGSTIELIAHPRIFGYAFNPISYFLLLDAKRELRAVICEVNNTFGDNHNYVLAHEDGRVISKDDVFYADKQLYVSPFNTMRGGYTFCFKKTTAGFGSDIVYLNNDEPVLKTAVYGTYTDCTSLSILTTYITYPLMTIMVVVRIHWQAVKLFFKKVPHTLHERPAPISGGFTRGYCKNK
jgi:uncharacterized protein